MNARQLKALERALDAGIAAKDWPSRVRAMARVFDLRAPLAGALDAKDEEFVGQDVEGLVAKLSAVLRALRKAPCPCCGAEGHGDDGLAVRARGAKKKVVKRGHRGSGVMSEARLDLQQGEEVVVYLGKYYNQRGVVLAVRAVDALGRVDVRLRSGKVIKCHASDLQRVSQRVSQRVAQ